MGFEHQNTNYPICPHCNYSHEDEWWNYCNNDDQNEIVCLNCNKDFWVSRCDRPNFTTGLTSEEV